MKKMPSVLLVGYNGANNTGSEARLLAIVDDVRSVIGQNALISIPTLNEKNLRRYITETQTLEIKPIPSIFYFSLRNLVKKHDIILLVEGSCYMDTWSTVLLRAFLWATAWAYNFGKPSIAYAVDSGHLSTSNAKRVKKEASKTSLIILRTQAAADRLKKLGIKAPIEVTADTAFCFDPKPEDKNILLNIWPQVKEKEVVGLALIDPYCWPVTMRIMGKRKDCYRWPYYFSRSPERKSAAEELSTLFAAEADRIIEEHKKAVAIICMESLDEAFAEITLENIKNRETVRIFSPNRYNASQMTEILRSSSYLISMRYHACVLSMANGIPMIGIAHDMRIPDLFAEIGIGELCFKYNEIQLSLLSEHVDLLINQSSRYHELILKSYKSHLIRAKKNRELLSSFLNKI